ncbi:MAG: RraA family protein [Chloroflexota bacterium]|nr:RraA family protein [Chloroflexota bacterium]
MAPLSPAELAELRKFSSPTLSNAIERFGVRPKNQGFMSPEIPCVFPDLAPLVGYAVTCTVAADQPAAGTRQAARDAYWEYSQTIPGPRISVHQDLDQPACVGAFFGDVNSNIHKSLGFAGAITNGSVRDLTEVHAIGFQFFAPAPSVSHAWVHMVDFGTPVKVGGLVVNPGDLLFADQHGVLLIPSQIAQDVAAVAREIESLEGALIKYCQSPEFTLAGLKPRFQEMRARIDGK